MMDYTERRRTRDRRSRHRPFALPAMCGRRRGYRRLADGGGERAGADLYPPRLAWLALSIMLLCVLDAHNTLMILAGGGRELNPLMDCLIRHDVRLFVIAKMLLTGIGVLLFVGYHRVRLLRVMEVRYVLHGFLGLYLLLVVYQWWLLAGGLVWH